MKTLFVSLLFSVTAFAVDPPPPVTDFFTPDVNAGSDRRKATSADVSPRNYLNTVSVWYFGDEG